MDLFSFDSGPFDGFPLVASVTPISASADLSGSVVINSPDFGGSVVGSTDLGGSVVLFAGVDLSGTKLIES